MTILEKYNYPIKTLFAALILVGGFSCTRDLDELELATFPTTAEVFIDGFSSGLNYAAFGGSKTTAFNVVDDEGYNNSAVMRFDIPDADDPGGGFAAGIFFTDVARDLSGYNVLTFWAKASESVDVDELGFGFTFQSEKYRSAIKEIPVTTNWKKYYIPIADASKLTEENGMFYYVDSPDDGEGYTFWIDEVKFENLSTLARPGVRILAGQDQSITAETGNQLNIGEISYTANLPTGIDQSVDISAAYLTFTSSNSGVATVDETGKVTILDAGNTVITATLGDLEATGSLTIESSGDPLLPATAAPVPTVGQDSVISLFSNAYDDVPVDTWNPFWQFSTAEVSDVKIGEDDLKRYNNLNFVGILTESAPIDASEMTHFHIDIWTPDPTAPPATFKVLLVDFGADGNFDGGDDSSHELTFTSPTLTTGSWVSLDIPLSDFTGLANRNHIAQLVLSGDLPNLFVDNVYFYQAGVVPVAEPAEAAPEPTAAASDVLSVFSDAYSNIEGTDLNPNWGQATVVSQVDIAGNNTLLYSGLNYQGIQLGSNQDVSGMEFLHIDYWTANSSGLNTFLISRGPVETAYALPVPTTGWASVDIPLSDFAPVDLTDVIQLKFDGNGNIYLDNIYFYKTGGGGMEPAVSAPQPTEAASEVIALFSDAYADVVVDTWRTDWSAAMLEDVSVAGNAVKKYSNLDFVGIETVANTVDASGMTHFRMDVWSPDFTFFGIKLVDFGTDGAFGGGDDVEHQINFEAPAQGQWISYDIPLSDFAGLTTRSNIAQYILVGQPTGTTTVYVDNVYFYNSEGGNNATEPGLAAPTPTEDASDVISLFSEAYSNVAVDTWRTDWSAAMLEDVSVAGNAVKKYSNLDFVGIETVANPIDASGMTYFHIDVWSSDFTFFGIKLVDFGADGAFGGGDDVEHQINFEAPAQGQWISYDIPLDDFVGLTTRSNMAQYILVGQPIGATTVYVDNVYFHK
ncbi:Ig-like domain-containing protein [Flavilitoribacter nigricans]|uniref:BIG2 domain-containing protein n=1 Tax=Flavilitoribacter nigricans (strain ATCC 23147 / DSM 23189 / NBRC 102662 / NCIMB 1420 / SS-2) TaxID=1122177 RepID=A0A2D0N447_FLAN2|nr:Ig-like domain-containing protein [Flavilitoribacter nigricans]PHN02919.1 hypothetical protein CRP01_29370 [Flavilitoribacter nigricans DSM 23189 = NBRC 102662]